MPPNATRINKRFCHGMPPDRSEQRGAAADDRRGDHLVGLPPRRVEAGWRDRYRYQLLLRHRGHVDLRPCRFARSERHKRHMHRSTGFRSDIAVDLQALVGLELKDVVGGREERARSAPIGQTNQPGPSCRR